MIFPERVEDWPKDLQFEARMANKQISDAWEWLIMLYHVAERREKGQPKNKSRVTDEGYLIATEGVSYAEYGTD